MLNYERAIIDTALTDACNVKFSFITSVHFSTLLLLLLSFPLRTHISSHIRTLHSSFLFFSFPFFLPTQDISIPSSRNVYRAYDRIRRREKQIWWAVGQARNTHGTILQRRDHRCGRGKLQKKINTKYQILDVHGHYSCWELLLHLIFILLSHLLTPLFFV